MTVCALLLGSAIELSSPNYMGSATDYQLLVTVRACVITGNGVAKLEPDLPMPGEEELNAKFAELVVSTLNSVK